TANGIPLGQTGLVLQELRGGVMFDATPLPSVTDPRDLLSPAFATTADMSLAQWEESLQQQIVRRAGGSGQGYMFDLPLTDANLLDGGTVNALLRSHILAESLVVTLGSPVQVVQAGQRWVIRDGSSTYLIERGAKSLLFSRVIAALKPSDVALTDGG